MKWTIVSIVAVIGMMHVQELFGAPLIPANFPGLPDVLKTQNMLQDPGSFKKVFASNGQAFAQAFAQIAEETTTVEGGSNGSTFKATRSTKNSAASSSSSSTTSKTRTTTR